MSKISKVQGVSISVKKINTIEYISLTDIAKYKSDEPRDVVRNWIRGKDTIEFLGLWEKINNPEFKSVEFDRFKFEAGTNAFTLTPKKWIEKTNSIGITSSSGRYGGTYAHQDIAFEFASWVSAEFKLYLIKEFQRLTLDEKKKNNLEWNVSRTLAKVNYRIHTDSIKQNLIPENINKEQKTFTYANEADMLNVALFSITAKEWRRKNPEKKGNIRDYATLEQLLVLANLENLNSEYIKEGLNQIERLIKLNKIAIEQMKILTDNKFLSGLKQLDE